MAGKNPLLKTTVLVLDGYLKMRYDIQRNETVGIVMEVVESKTKIVIMLLHVCMVCRCNKCCAALGPFLRPQKTVTLEKSTKVSDLGGKGK